MKRRMKKWEFKRKAKKEERESKNGSKKSKVKQKGLNKRQKECVRWGKYHL
jgi:hypothetical protein